MKCGSWLVVFILAAAIPSPAAAQSSHPNLEGMWSDPPVTAVAEFCASWCTDAGIDYLNKLLDDPSNDSRSFEQLQAEAAKHQLETYILPRLTAAARKTYPLDPADDPSFLRCVPYGLGKQIIARHQLDIRQRGNDRLEFRYGEWDARRTIYMNDGKQPVNQAPALLGNSVGHWDGEALVVETSGIRANRLPFSVEHSDQLHIVERYTRSKDNTLTLTATMEDPLSLREPVVIQHIWRWAPESKIAPYVNCERPTEFKKGVRP